MKKFELLLDLGHGVPARTGGKHSPDMSLIEPVYCREVGNMLCNALDELGIKYRVIVPELEDISLGERCKRINAIVNNNKDTDFVLISIHNNAAPPNDNQWHSARGWSVWVYNGASEKSKILANSLNDAAKEMNLKVRQPEPKQKYYTANFYILRNTKCPAVLTENFFQDNKEDVEWLLSDEGKAAVVNIHVAGILKYLHHPYVIKTS